MYGTLLSSVASGLSPVKTFGFSGQKPTRDADAEARRHIVGSLVPPSLQGSLRHQPFVPGTLTQKVCIQVGNVARSICAHGNIA